MSIEQLNETIPDFNSYLEEEMKNTGVTSSNISRELRLEIFNRYLNLVEERNQVLENSANTAMKIGPILKEIVHQAPQLRYELTR